MSNSIERDWTTKAGLRAVCMQVRESDHRCGYVEVPEGHPLFGLEYSDTSPAIKDAWKEALDGPIGKRGIISVLCAAKDDAVADEPRIDAVFDVHGSLTYSGSGSDGYPVQSTTWWFGFDCSHYGDQTLHHDGEERTQEYVESECESLAEQLAAVAEHMTESP